MADSMPVALARTPADLNRAAPASRRGTASFLPSTCTGGDLQDRAGARKEKPPADRPRYNWAVPTEAWMLLNPFHWFQLADSTATTSARLRQRRRMMARTPQRIRLQLLRLQSESRDHRRLHFPLTPQCRI